MAPRWFAGLAMVCGGSLVSGADAQTLGGAATAPPGLVGAPRPGTRVRAVKPDSTLPDAKMRALPKPTAAELAEKRKLDHDLKICIGC